MTISSNDIRSAFLQYFKDKGHTVVASAPLPQEDNPTLLFTNAGMNQFTNTFLGLEKRPYTRAATSQKVLRISGKHNDLENVGPSPRHHTFFEMLGNFSFGDYFKEDAIAYAWEFLTSPKYMGLDINRLWVSIYEDDDEAFELWQAHVPPERILRFDKAENFWEMGDVGPCGPCSEIHYYWGDIDKMTPEGVNVDDHYLEVWNLVFMQYEKDSAGNLTPLPRPSIDTGMGLERIAAAVQQVDNNYDTDLFTPAMDVVQELLRHSDEEREEGFVAYRVIADHVRAATFLIADGVRPGNDGPDYVLRMVIRRAAKFGRELGFSEPFMALVAQAYINEMGEDYPELRGHADSIKYTLTQEEERFSKTLDRALIQLEKVLGDLEKKGEKELPGDIAFDLYGTHGLPVEITNDVAVARGLTVDETGFFAAKEAHAKASGSGAFSEYETEGNVYSTLLTDLIASGKLESNGVRQEPYGNPRLEAEVVAILKEGERTDIAKQGEMVEVVTYATPFYVESGGQVSDIGTITVSQTGGQMRVKEMQRPLAGLLLHVGKIAHGELRLGDRAMLRVDDSRRADIRRNHTATHILHEELRRHLGSHVTQAGSLVAPDRLRFDFSHGEAVDRETLRTIEKAVNDRILQDEAVVISFMGQKEAISNGAVALFGEKYGDVVRTVKIGEADDPYSFELCGGLHVTHTGDIQQFRFTNESSVGSGVRRVEAVTGNGARVYVQERLALLDQLAGILKSPVTETAEKLESLLEETRTLRKQVEQLKQALLADQLEDSLSGVQAVDGVNVLATQVAATDADGLRQMADKFRDKYQSGVAVFGTVNKERPLLVAVVTKDLQARGLHAGNLIREVAKLVGGGGGGAPHMAQAGGKDPDRLPAALEAVPGMVSAALNE